MTLRYKLFFLVGGVFVFAFLFSYYVETVFAKKKLHVAKRELRSDIENTEKYRIERLQEFIAFLCSRNVAEAESSLKSFNPEKTNVEQPVFATDFLKENHSIDFLQITTSKTGYVLLPDITLLKEYQKQPISQHLCWIFDRAMPAPKACLGLQMTKGKYILLDPKNFSENLFADRQKLEEEFPLLAFSLKEAASLQNQLEPPAFNAEAPLKRDPCVSDAYPYIQTDAENIRLKKKMIQMLHVLFKVNAWDAAFPLIGIAQFDQDSQGVGFLREDVLIEKPLFNAAQFLRDHPPVPGCAHISRSVALIDGTPQDNVFLGSCRQMHDDESYQMTVGIDVAFAARALALLHREIGLLAYQGRWMEGFSPDGIRQQRETYSSLPLEEMLQHKAGEVFHAHKQYFFLHIVPFPELDLHFFLLNPTLTEFYFLQKFEVKGEKIINQISRGMRLIALFALLAVLLALHRVSRKITDPIRDLAAATQKVKKGHYSEVVLPLKPLVGRDEIASLYHAFREMVQGLIEKEKVQGILNKVVSPEVATEIMKGELHLGGEETLATIFFADIRNFTGITERMQPHEVIELLNACMTRISKIIESHHGVIDKYIGDEVMALFGVPLKMEEAAKSALMCALEVVEELKSWNQEREKNGLPIANMGIGVATGLVVAGNMGAENRLNYTVLGRNVNIAARLCEIAEPLEILANEKAVQSAGVEERIRLEKKGMISLKGFVEPISVYRILGLR